MQEGNEICCGYCGCCPVLHINHDPSSTSLHVQPGKDVKGVERSHCKECGDKECPSFMLDENGGSYCRCHPTRHVRVNKDASERSVSCSQLNSLFHSLREDP